MKKLQIILLCVGSLLVNAPSYAQNSPIVANTSESHSVFTGLFKSIWVQLKSINPQMENHLIDLNQVQTAGISGAKDDTLLKPYWKNDLTQDEKFQAELQEFSLAQQKMNNGELELAELFFDNFLDEYENSNLRPNALLGKSISLAALGQNEQSLAVMQQFVSENPNHPLVGDARQAIGELASNRLVAVANPASPSY